MYWWSVLAWAIAALYGAAFLAAYSSRGKREGSQPDPAEELLPSAITTAVLAVVATITEVVRDLGYLPIG